MCCGFVWRCCCVCLCVCVCVTFGVTRFLSECFYQDFCFSFSLEFEAGGARDPASLALTKTLALVCDIAPGRWSYVYTCFEKNLRKSKAVQYVVSALRVSAVKG